MFNDFIALRLGQERASELFREAEEAGLTQRRRRARPQAARVWVGLVAAGVTLAVVILGLGI